jgi:phytoene dehydrogenase-like protein
MKKFDVAIVGGGIAGLVSAAILSKRGKKVIVFEKENVLGGRARTISYQGYTLNTGGTLLEDPGSGLMKIYRYLGKKLEAANTNQGMPVWSEGKWYNVRDLYDADRNDLKKIIKELVSMDFSELEKYDDIPLRTWLLKRTKSQGIIDLFEYLAILECITHQWYDHVASDNLFVRKMHYQERNMAGYSYWPKGGYQNLFTMLEEVIKQQGGEVQINAKVHKVVIKDGSVKGVEVERGVRIMSNQIMERELILADNVISTLTVWDVLNVVDEKHLPEWYTNNIKMLAQDENRVTWLGLYIASDQPVYALQPRELCTWAKAPKTGLAGWGFQDSDLQPDVAPNGKHLFVCGACIDGKQMKDKDWVDRNFDLFESELEEMFPQTRHAIWKYRHVSYGSMTFQVVQKPGMVGWYRPHFIAPTVSGLYFASDTFRSRGIGVDRSARAGLTAAEHLLGERIPEMEGTWRY